MSLYLGAAGTRGQAITWIKTILPNASDAIINELADLSDENQVIIRDPLLWPEGRMGATDKAAPRVNELIRMWRKMPQF